MSRPLRWYDAISINIYYTGLMVIAQTMTPLVAPLLVQAFVGESQQGTYYGTLRLWSLMAALLAQALMGMLSDRSTHKLGRRRPFIFAGTLLDLVFIALIGFSAGLEGLNGFWTLFVLLIFLQLSLNIGQGALQGLIPDLVPEDRRGFFSGVKALFEVPIPVILVSFTIGRMISAGQMWTALATAMGVLFLTMLVTITVPEKRLEGKQPPLDWAPIIRLGLMTALFTVVILGMGWLVRALGSLLVYTSLSNQLVGMGLLGFATMLVAVAIGVYMSVSLSIGKDAKENPSFTWWVINRLAYLVGSTNLSSFAIYFLQGRMGFAREAAAKPASQLILLVGVFILVLAVPSGWLADKFGRKPLVAIAGLTAALGVLVLILAPNMTVVYIGGVIVGAATGLFFTANWALGTMLAPKEEAGRYLGISNLAGAGAGAVGAYIGGPIADYFTVQVPSQPGLGYVVLFAIYGGLFLFSVIALAGVKRQA